MRSSHDQFIHELSIIEIIRILESDAWSMPHQSITSAVTNDNDLKELSPEWMAIGENTAGINAFADVKFDPNVKRILDVGGGKFDCNRHYMKREKHIDLLVWDPYNRSPSHNDSIQKKVEADPVDAVTSMSVLNVIPEVMVRLTHINTLKAALCIGGKAYFKIWPGERPLLGSYLPSATDTYYQANAFADRFLREIEIVFGIGSVKLDDVIPNLIVAVKSSDTHTSEIDIAMIQKISADEMKFFDRMRESAIRQLYSKSLHSYLNSSSFFWKVRDKSIERNRHCDLSLQREYDKRWGLSL